MSYLGVWRGGCSRRCLSQLERQGDGDLWEFPEVNPQYKATYGMQWIKKELLVFSHPWPKEDTIMVNIPSEMDVADRECLFVGHGLTLLGFRQSSCVGNFKGIGWLGPQLNCTVGPELSALRESSHQR